jgi:hypothetical protein
MAVFLKSRLTLRAPSMKLLFDMFPVVLFFLAYTAGSRRRPPTRWLQVCGAVGAGTELQVQQAPIRLATAVAIVATVAQVSWLLARGRTPSSPPCGSSGEHWTSWMRCSPSEGGCRRGCEGRLRRQGRPCGATLAAEAGRRPEDLRS